MRPQTLYDRIYHRSIGFFVPQHQLLLTQILKLTGLHTCCRLVWSIIRGQCEFVQYLWGREECEEVCTTNVPTYDRVCCFEWAIVQRQCVILYTPAFNETTMWGCYVDGGRIRSRCFQRYTRNNFNNIDDGISDTCHTADCVGLMRANKTRSEGAIPFECVLRVTFIGVIGGWKGGLRCETVWRVASRGEGYMRGGG